MKQQEKNQADKFEKTFPNSGKMFSENQKCSFEKGI